MKYKGTVLGMAWSLLSPLMQLVVMRMVFVNFFGRSTPHYTMYLLAGNIVMSYYKESTKNGMRSLVSNSGIYSKIMVPKYLFVLSQNVSCFINFLLTIVIFFIFGIFDKVTFSWKFCTLIVPTILLCIFCVGIGMILSALQVFYRDTSYFYDIFLVLLTYVSAIFYTIDRFSESAQKLFLCNPVYVFINYYRKVVIDTEIPSLQYHGLCCLYAFGALLIGCIIYKRHNNKFLYYV